VSALLLLVSALASAALRAQSASGPAGGTAAATDGKDPRTSHFLVPRGDGLEPVEIPRLEELEYVVEIDVGILGDLEVGHVTLTSGVEPYHPGLPPSGSTPKPGPPQFVGWIRSVAHGSYLGYELQHELEVRHLPQAWPSAFYRDTQSGSENRRRELKFGLFEGKSTSLYRSDGHCNGCSNPEHFVESAWLWGKPYHCKKCKRGEHRVWNPPQTRAIPPDTVDLLTAVYLARSMIREGRSGTTFPVLDKKKLWTLTLERGPTKTVEVPAGKFRCALVQLRTAVPPGEPHDPDGFEGLFGIRGAIRIWMEASTGVPVMISGELPVPVVQTLGLNIRMQSYRGTAPGFLPAR
jgi:hypothetical protein